MPSNAFDPGPLTTVRCEPTGARWTLQLDWHYPQPPAAVWALLTEPSQLLHWAPFDARPALDQPGPVTLEMVDGDSRTPMNATVLKARAPALLEYDWGGDLLRWQLQADGGSTQLRLAHTTGERAWVPKIAAGWHLCLAVAGRHLAGKPVGRIVGRAARQHGWEALNSAYAQQLGITDTGWPEGM